MNKSFPPEIQQRLRTLYRYVRAMEAADSEALASLLHAAEQDAFLDRMFQEVDLHYLALDQMQVQPVELAEVNQWMARLSRQMSEQVQDQQNGYQARPAQTPLVFPLPQERRHPSMYYQPTPLPSEQAIHDLPQTQLPARKPRGKRSARFLQTLAAMLVVAALLGGFLMLYGHFTNRQPSLGVAVQSTTQVQPPGMIISVADATAIDRTSPTNQTGTFTAYALRSAQPMPIWSTLLMQSSAMPPPESIPLIVQKGIAYIGIANHVFVLRIDTGKVLWQKTLPFDPTHQVALQVDGNMLIVGGQDANFVATIYRLDEQNGSFLWHYQTDNNTAFTVSSGVVYTGKDKVNSMFTPNPGSLRSLIALNGENGDVLWNHDNINPLDLTVKNGTLYVQSIAADNTGSDKRYFLSAWTSSGHRLWSVSGPAQVPIVSDSGLLVIENGSDLCVYQAANGHSTWCTHNPMTTITVSGMKLTVGASYSDYEAQNGILYTAYTLQISGTSTHQSTAAFLEARDIQSGAVIWSKKVGTVDTDITHKGAQTIMQKPRVVGLNFGLSRPILLSQNTLSIPTSTSVFTFSLLDGHPLWQTSIKTLGDSANFVASAYVVP